MNYIWSHVTNSTHDLYPNLWISHVTNSTYDLYLYIYITHEVTSRTQHMTGIFACKLHMKSRHELNIWLVSHELYTWLVSLEGNDSCVRAYHIEIHILWISHELYIWTSHVTTLQMPCIFTYKLHMKSRHELYVWFVSHELYTWFASLEGNESCVRENPPRDARHVYQSRTLHMTCIFTCELHVQLCHKLYVWFVSHELYTWLVSLQGHKSCVHVYLHIETHVMWISHELYIWTSHVTNSTCDLYLYIWITDEVTSRTLHIICKSRTLHMTCIASR